MESWNTRLATLNDLEALQQLLTVSARGLNSEHYTPQQVESLMRYIYRMDEQLIHDQTYFVVQTNDTFIGCGGWSKRHTSHGDDHPTEDYLLNPATDAARIRAFFVHPDWARKGVGSLLMRACEQAARDAGFRSIEMMATLTGEFLYVRFGYEIIEAIDDRLPDGTIIKARRMKKDLLPLEG